MFSNSHFYHPGICSLKPFECGGTSVLYLGTLSSILRYPKYTTEVRLHPESAFQRYKLQAISPEYVDISAFLPMLYIKVR